MPNLVNIMCALMFRFLFSLIDQFNKIFERFIYTSTNLEKKSFSTFFDVQIFILSSDDLMGNQLEFFHRAERKICNGKNSAKNGEIFKKFQFDQLIEKTIWAIWLKTRPKSSANFKREDLMINIDWKDVFIEQDAVEFVNSSTFLHPQSQTLFRTTFENQTNNEHFYTLKTERNTFSTLKFQLTQALGKSNESTIRFRLPDSITGISRDQQISFQCDTTKEFEIRWPIDSQIRLAARTRTSVELLIDEEEFQSQFVIPIRFAGEIQSTIVHRQSTENILKTIRIDLVQLVREARKTHDEYLPLQIHDEFVRFEIRGKCSFRYGIKENISLHQESFDSSSSSISCTDLRYSPSAPTDYCRLTSLNFHPNSSWPMGQAKL